MKDIVASVTAILISFIIGFGLCAYLAIGKEEAREAHEADYAVCHPTFNLRLMARDGQRVLHIKAQMDVREIGLIYEGCDWKVVSWEEGR